MSPIEVYCPYCRAGFQAPDSQKSGLAACPECQKAVPVPGGPEPLFWVILGGSILGALLVSGIMFFGAGPFAGLVTLAVCIVGIVVWALIA